jgi:hypothetical protein
MVRVASGWTSSKVKLRVSQRLPKRLMTTLLYCTALQYRTHATAVPGEKSRHDEREGYVLRRVRGAAPSNGFLVAKIKPHGGDLAEVTHYLQMAEGGLLASVGHDHLGTDLT